MGPLEVIATIQEDGPDDSLERLVHKYFSHFCIYGREWYSCEEEIVRLFSSNITGELVKAEIEKSRPELLISPETTRAELERGMIEKIKLSSLTPDLKSLLLRFYDSPVFMKRMEMLCTSDIEYEDIKKYLPEEFIIYIDELGLDRIKLLYYHKNKVAEEYNRVTQNKIREGALKERLYEEFRIGDRKTLKDIKARLKKIYEEVNYVQSAKASDLAEYFVIRRCLVTDRKTKHRYEGFEILSIKGEEGI